jgi:hypothetical protein
MLVVSCNPKYRQNGQSHQKQQSDRKVHIKECLIWRGGKASGGRFPEH